nr:HAD-IA family hydrolase [uncultured Methanoregula sp.]
MYNTIILDFDGVILESVSVKTDAFRELFSFTPEHVETIVEFHKKNGGMSRFDKFRYIYREFLHEELMDTEMQALSGRFSRLVFDKVISAPFVPGAEEFLNRYSGEKNLYVVSATPQEELEDIIQQRGIRHFFKKIYGSPQKKADHIRTILSDEATGPESVVFIGDAVNDWKAAREAGIPFIARLTQESRGDFLDLPGIDGKITDLFGLIDYVGGMECSRNYRTP